MNKVYKILIAITVLAVGQTMAQDRNWCGQNLYRDFLDSEYPGYSLRAEEARQQMLRQLAEDPTIGQYRGGVRTIPIVFHVVWNTSQENVSDAVIQQQLNRLNADFSNAYLSTQVTQFQNVAVNPQIQFCLATTDPQGNPTTGITRTQTSVTSFAVDNDMKSSSTGGKNPWPFGSYYNVWVCDIGFDPNQGGTAGFAYLPSYGSQFEAIDGTVLAYQVVGGGETTLSHETGHYMGLNHTWGADFESCSDDDGFTDTPNCDGPNFGSWQDNYCPLTTQSCGSLDNVENFMDYASCPTMFTSQQSAYMNSILSTTYSASWPNAQAGRASLVTSNGCAGQQGSAPVADFVGSPTTVPVGVNVSFTDLSTNSPTTWSWNFGDGGATSSAQNPVRSYAAPGQYTVSLTASNGSGSDVETKVNYITVTQGGGGSTTCDTLVYLDGQFIAVINATDEPTFTASLIDNDQAAVATTLADAGYTSGWLSFYEEVAPLDTNWSWGATSWHTNTSIPADNWITFGPITIPSDGADLEWKHSFMDMDYRDGYRVMLNYTGTAVANFTGGTVLFNLPSNDASTASETAWGSRSVNLSAGTYAGQQVYIGFHHNALDMFVLLLDDMMMYGCNTAPVGLNEAGGVVLNVYPNPSSDNFTVRMETAQRDLAQMTLSDALGRKVWSKAMQIDGALTTEIDTRSLPAGIYILSVNGEKMNLSRKLVLSK
ncbi:MAG: PKD domain-containing protein [Flavobacteriales bacterium]|nr:PKD domain-containing protein [Flavobacteriales bacterium]